MNLFRSEDHVTRWLGDRTPGTTITIRTLSELAHLWWSDRLDENWRPHTREHNQGLLDHIDLTGPFWQLA